MSLVTWSWIFVFGYMSLLVGIGVYAQRQIKHADDFGTARGFASFDGNAWAESKRDLEDIRYEWRSY